MGEETTSGHPGRPDGKQSTTHKDEYARRKEEMGTVLRRISTSQPSTASNQDEDPIAASFWGEVEGAEERHELPDEQSRALWDYFHHDRYSDVTRRHRRRALEIDRQRAAAVTSKESELTAAEKRLAAELQQAEEERAGKVRRAAAAAEEVINAARAQRGWGIGCSALGGLIVIMALDETRGLSRVSDGWAIGIGLCAIVLLIGIGLLVMANNQVNQAEAARAAEEDEAKSEYDSTEARLSQQRADVRKAIQDAMRGIEQKAKQELDTLAEIMARFQELIPRDPTDTEVDTWLQELRHILEAEGRRRSGVHSDESLVREPVVIWAPAVFQDDTVREIQGRDLKDLQPDRIDLFRIGQDDGVPRFAVLYVQQILPTAEHVSLYSAIIDVIGRHVYGETIDQYFYGDIVSVATQAARRPLGGEPEAARFAIALTSGEGVSIRLEDEGKLAELQRRAEAKLDEDRRQCVEELRGLLGEFESSHEEKAHDACNMLYGRFVERARILESLPDHIRMARPPVGLPDGMIGALRTTIQERKAAAVG